MSKHQGRSKRFFTRARLIEIVSTTIPYLMPGCLMAPSPPILYLDTGPALTRPFNVTASGSQWHRVHESIDSALDCGGIYESFLAFLRTTNPRYLLTDNSLALPREKHIRLPVTATDVIHSWAVPNPGSKPDAIPGRSNTTTLKTLSRGNSHGQCSELCGHGHGLMPIAVNVG